jgi:hypothetical protein
LLKIFEAFKVQEMFSVHLVPREQSNSHEFVNPLPDMGSPHLPAPLEAGGSNQHCIIGEIPEVIHLDQ